MRRLAANYVLPVGGDPIKNGIVEVDDDGVVQRIIVPSQNFVEIHSTEFYNGVIVPGFVNAHCHLELSHLKGRFPANLGLAGFVKTVETQRDVEQAEVQSAIKSALLQMDRTGTVAVGDICNTAHTIACKRSSHLNFHNFVEVFGIHPTQAPVAFAKAEDVYAQFNGAFPNATSMAPHAPYSISDELWCLLGEHLAGISSIHFAESMDEYYLLTHHRGVLFDRYRQKHADYAVPSGGSPAGLIMQQISPQCEMLLVHCIYASEEELRQLSNHFQRATFVTCPESNLFIEGRMADLPLMVQMGLNIAVGTDSLASATTLSMLHNINLILNTFTDIPFGEVLKWATLNGARALHIDGKFGTIEAGKQPGLNLIDGFDFVNMRPTEQSRVVKLV